MKKKIHQVCASAISEGPDSESFAIWEARAAKLSVVAHRLGFSVMYENVDEPEPADPLSRLEQP